MKPVSGCLHGINCSNADAHLPGTQVLLWLRPEETEAPACVLTGAGERKGRRLRQGGGRTRAALHPGKAPAYFISLGLGRLRCRGPGGSSLRAATPAPPKFPVLRGWGGRGARAPGLRGFGGADEGSALDKAQSGPRQAAPSLRALGETTASGGGCGMQARRPMAAREDGLVPWQQPMAARGGDRRRLRGFGPPSGFGGGCVRVCVCVFACVCVWVNPP